MPAATIALCDDEGDEPKCLVRKVHANVTLNSRTDDAAGCDRPMDLSEEVRKACDVGDDVRQLLPAARATSEKERMLASNRVPSDKERQPVGYTSAATVTRDVQGHTFDGRTTSMEVDSLAPLPSTFSLSFWMRHDAHTKGGGHDKENIVCVTDEHRASRGLL